jgi:hypothetical protein
VTTIIRQGRDRLRGSLPRCLANTEIFQNFVLVITILKLKVRHRALRTPEPERIDCIKMKRNPRVKLCLSVKSEIITRVQEQYGKKHRVIAAAGNAAKRASLFQLCFNVARKHLAHITFDRITLERTEDPESTQGKCEKLKVGFVAMERRDFGAFVPRNFEIMSKHMIPSFVPVTHKIDFAQKVQAKYSETKRVRRRLRARSQPERVAGGTAVKKTPVTGAGVPPFDYAGFQ